MRFNYYKVFKGLVAAATLFIYLFHPFQFHTFYNHIHPLHLSISIRRGISNSSLLVGHRGKPQWGAEPRFELWPAIQQASALMVPTEVRSIQFF
jgi:hypothetical protein